ncbi:MAG TPA: DUF2789 domain-containing protein [Methylococcaceae bacterium]|nr:DUF2789 domain-containing protein [Methylococcaceae bacterium]HVO80948.1 DUF2789 domain-containing protein [Terriglobales bacterium]
MARHFLSDKIQSNPIFHRITTLSLTDTLLTMDTSAHNMQTLFLQLGLPNRPEDVQSFIQSHKPLAPDIPLPHAEFWSASQAAFLREAIEEDSDWCEIVDELDSQLRR